MLTCTLWLALSAAPTSTYAIVIGHNESTNPDATTLEFADDDAYQYAQLFAELGASVELLTNADRDTARLYASDTLNARPPTLENLRRAFDRFEAWEKIQSEPTTLYFVYAGHGDVKHGEGYLTLEDRELPRSQFYREVLDRAQATTAHVIIDACKSYLMVFDRSAQQQRRRFTGSFDQHGVLARWPHIGFLLSTSSAKNSHEWEAFQAGVFSHEVRSGLRGAADTDGDQQITYSELVAFVTWANQKIPNAKYVPEVMAAPPRTHAVLAYLNGRRTLDVDRGLGRHLIFESGAGIRLADLRREQPGPLMLPNTLVFARDGNEEYRIEASAESLSELTPSAPETRERGAEHEAFRLLFAEPFGPDALGAANRSLINRDALDLSRDWELDDNEQSRVGLWTGIGIGGALAVAGGAAFLYSDSTYDRFLTASNNERPDLQQRIERADRAGWTLLGGAILTAGASWLLYELDWL
ncbi:MAG: caspase family protein [Myxococcota bacterium]